MDGKLVRWEKGPVGMSQCGSGTREWMEVDGNAHGGAAREWMEFSG